MTNYAGSGSLSRSPSASAKYSRFELTSVTEASEAQADTCHRVTGVTDSLPSQCVPPSPQPPGYQPPIFNSNLAHANHRRLDHTSFFMDRPPRIASSPVPGHATPIVNR